MWDLPIFYEMLNSALDEIDQSYGILFQAVLLPVGDLDTWLQSNFSGDF